MSSRGGSAEPETRFPGYGDRVGSGVVLAPTRWTGGEIITDPEFLNKSLKPRRMFYSPIGDGVVAADGIELKRGPVDLTPKVEVITQRITEKGPSGQAGRTVTERTWTSGGGGSSNEQINQQSSGVSAQPPAVPPKPASPAPFSSAANQNQNSAAAPANNAASPFEGLSDLLGSGPTSRGSGAGAPTPAAADPLKSYTKPLGGDFGGIASAPASNYNSLGSRSGTDPYGTLTSLRSGPGLYDSLPKSDLNGSQPGGYAQQDYPASGRSSTTSAMFSEPGYRYEIKKDYKVTNPKELIHQYATTTPVHTIPGYEQLPDGGTTTRMIKQSYSSRTEETYSPFPPYTGGPNSVNPNKFVRQLRDENLTITQRQANQQQQPLNQNKDPSYDQRLEQIRRQASSVSPNNEVDLLTHQLVNNLHTRKY